MAKVSAFHSSKTKDVYHDCSKCKTGNNIEAANRASGTGGLPRCAECARLEKGGEC